MPSITVYNMAGEAVEELELSERVFGIEPNVPVLHQVVTAQMVNRRQGNASTKTRAEVSGGNSKPYRQKGTGRARQGSTRAPQFRHGGTVFGPRPHVYHHDVPKKMRRLAIRSALSDKVANQQLIVLQSLSLEAPRTKEMLALLERLPLNGKRTLMMLPRRDENVLFSARNIATAKVQHVASINVVELLKHDNLVMPVETVRWIELVFGEGLSADEASARVADMLAAELAQAEVETPAESDEAASDLVDGDEVEDGEAESEPADADEAEDDEEESEPVDADEVEDDEEESDSTDSE
jgi:large subunit ribosomal protein L4